jgi:hypothetical protein
MRLPAFSSSVFIWYDTSVSCLLLNLKSSPSDAHMYVSQWVNKEYLLLANVCLLVCYYAPKASNFYVRNLFRSLLLLPLSSRTNCIVFVLLMMSWIRNPWVWSEWWDWSCNEGYEERGTNPSAQASTVLSVMRILMQWGLVMDRCCQYHFVSNRIIHCTSRIN